MRSPYTTKTYNEENRDKFGYIYVQNSHSNKLHILIYWDKYLRKGDQEWCDSDIGVWKIKKLK